MSISERYADDNINAIWWLDIAGVRVRYGTGLPSWNPADSGTNRPIKDYMCKLPKISAQSIEPLDGTTTPPSASVAIADIDDEITSLLSSSTALASRTVLTEDVTASATTITVGDATAFNLPCDIYIDAETMRATAATDGTHLTVTRGMYGSTAAEHLVTTAQGYQRTVYVVDRPPFIIGRKATLYESRLDYDDDDESFQVAFSGRIESVSDDDGAWEFKIGGNMAALGKVLGLDAPTAPLKYALWGGKTDDFTGAGFYDLEDILAAWSLDAWLKTPMSFRTACSTWCIYFEDATVFPDDVHSLLVGGEVIRYQHIKDAGAFAGKVLVLDDDYEDYPTSDIDVFYSPRTTKNRGLFSAEIFKNRGYYANIPRLMQSHQPGEQAKLVVTHHDFTQGTDPVSVLLTILQSSGRGDNGDYDILPEQYGCDISEDDIDISGMLAIQRKYFGGYDLKFAITENVSAKEWLEKNILRPFLLNLYESPSGKISLTRMVTLHEAQYDSGAISIGENDLLEIPALKYGAPPIGEIKWEINKDPGGSNRYGKITVIFDGTREKYGRLARRIGPLTLDTCYEWSVTYTGDATIYGGQNSYITLMLADYIATVWDRFADTPVPKIEMRLPYAWLAYLEIGAVVKVTCSGVPSLLDASRGLSNAYFQVVEISPNPSDSSITVEALQLGMNERNHRMIAPSAVVSSYDSGTRTVTLSGGTYVPSTEFAADGLFSAGDKVIFLTSSYGNKGGAPPEVFTLSSVGLNSVVLEETPTSAPASTDIMEIAYYTEQVSAQRAKYASLADSDGMLNSGLTEGHIRS